MHFINRPELNESKHDGIEKHNTFLIVKLRLTSLRDIHGFREEIF